MSQQTQTLHLVSFAPGNDRLAPCLTALAAGDAVVLLGEGCYFANIQNAAFGDNVSLYAMKTDLETRGLTPTTLTAISHQDLVNLTIQYGKSITW